RGRPVAPLRSGGRACGAPTVGRQVDRVMMKAATCVAAGALFVALAAQTHSPQTHRLEATPSTVAYGYYWSDAKPALRIASGDIIDVDTLLTNSPVGLARAGEFVSSVS